MTTVLPGELKVIPYQNSHAEMFRKLNETWINRYFRMEDADYRALNDPEGYIINKGGFIFMALYDDEIVGTCALIKINEEVFELAKMAVGDNILHLPFTCTVNWGLKKCRCRQPGMKGLILKWS